MPSPALKALIEAHIPYRPLCSQQKNFGQVRPASFAINSRYVQLNPPHRKAWLILDIDEIDAKRAWIDAELPPPTYAATNPANGHAHLGYALSTPVCSTDAARQKPLRFLAAIERAFMAASGADIAFRGPLGKNPLHPSWDIWEPANGRTFELHELAEYVDLTVPVRFHRPQGIGRNCDLFDGLREWAYPAVRQFWTVQGEERWRSAVLDRAHDLNSFNHPLGAAEVAGIARSVAKYVWRRFTPAGFSRSQSERGKLGGVESGRVRRQQSDDKRTNAKALADAGHSIRQIAATLEASKSSVARWLAE